MDAYLCDVMKSKAAKTINNGMESIDVFVLLFAYGAAQCICETVSRSALSSSSDVVCNAVL